MNKLYTIALLVLTACICSGCRQSLSSAEQSAIKQTACNFLNAMRQHDVSTMVDLGCPNTAEMKVLRRLRDNGKSEEFINGWLYRLGIQDDAPINLDTLRVNTDVNKKLLRNITQFLMLGSTDKSISDVVVVEYQYQQGQPAAVILMTKSKNEWLVATLPSLTTNIYKYRSMEEAMEADIKTLVPAYQYSSEQQKAKMLERTK